MSIGIVLRLCRAPGAMLGAAAGFVCLLAGSAIAASAPDGDAQTATPQFRGLRELAEYERYELARLPWAGIPDADRLKKLRQAWTAMTVHDDETARDMVEKDAAAGDANARFLMAGVLLDALGRNEHFDEAMDLLKKAADQGQPAAAFWLGRIRDQGLYGTPADQAEAIYWYRMADALGHPEADSQLCWLYGQGIGVPRDVQQALIYCQRGAERGSGWSLNRLGYMYSWGIAVSRDQEKAFDWVMKAAVTGYPMAERVLALRYLRGLGTKPDPVEAIEWLSRAADQGDVEAFLELGTIYRDGLTGMVDLPKAATWFRMAAQKGNAAGRYEYGLALQEGRGVNEDLVQAYLWYSLAALQGYPKAEGALARLKAGMNSDQLDRATRMADAARSRKPNE
jgi:TPR repeat protein